MTVLPGCACSCCGATGPLVTPSEIPTNQSFAAFLNATGTFSPANTITPKVLSGSGFTPIGNATAVGGTVSFVTPEVETLSVFGTVRVFAGSDLEVTLPNGTTGSVTQLAAQPGVAPWFPLLFLVTNTGGRRLTLAGQSVNTTEAYTLNFRLEPELIVTPLNDAERLVTLRHLAAPELDKFYFLRDLPELSQDPEARWRQDLECRVVVERDGVVVLDQVRPTGNQYAAAIAPQGSYTITKFFADAFDLQPPSIARPPRPSRLISSLRVDQRAPIVGFVPWSDSDQVVEANDRPMVAFSSHPSLITNIQPGVFREDEANAGESTRPAAASLVDSPTTLRVSVSSPVGSHPVTGGVIRELAGVSSEGLRSFGGVLPASLPVLRFVEHPALPGGKRMPALQIEHPGFATREQFRPRSQSERVSTIRILFKSRVQPATNGRLGQVTFTVDGSPVAGASFQYDADEQAVTIQLPVGQQVQGAFCVVEFDPNGAFVSDDDDAIETYLAVRTSWLMQRPYPRLPDVSRRDIVIGTHASVAATGPAPSTPLPLVVNPGAQTSLERSSPDSGRIGVASLRKGRDTFLPHLPAGPTGPADCSYYGLTTTIHPSPAKRMDCPMPRISEPHNSAFLHGGGTNTISIELIAALNTTNPLLTYGPLVFRKTRSGQTMAPNTYILDAGQNFGYLVAQRRVTQYEALETAHPWELLLDMRAFFTNPSSIAAVTNVFVIDSAKESLGTFEADEYPFFSGVPIRRWRITL